MRALIVESPGGPVELVPDVQIDRPADDEILVDVRCCGLCSTDVHIIEGTIPFPMPAICGHEVAGSILELGARVTGLRPGDEVVVSCRPACGRCYWCLRGEQHLCGNSLGWATGLLDGERTGLRRGGQPVYRGVGVAGFAEQVLVKAPAAVRLPAGVPLDLASILGCGVLTGVGAVFNTARVEAGATVLVVGLGGVGMSAVQGARIVGASVIVGVDPAAERRELALHLGATHVLDASPGEVLELVRTQTRGCGVDHAFDTVGAQATTALAFDATRAGGTVVVVGVPPGGASITLPAGALVSMEKKVTGCFVGSGNPAFEIPRLLRLWESGQLQLEPMVTRRRPVTELNDAIADMKATVGLRTVLTLA